MPKKFAAQFVTATAWLMSASIIALGAWVFAIDRYDPATNRYYDGFGRELRPSAFPGPHGTELSPGLLWSIADMVIGIVLVGICASLFVLGKRLKSAATDHHAKSLSPGPPNSQEDAAT